MQKVFLSRVSVINQEPGGSSPRSVPRFRRAITRAVVAVMMVLVALDLVVAWRYWNDSRSLAHLAQSLVAAADPPSEKMRAVASFLHYKVDQKRTEDYFLLPIFSCLRPTAAQVIEGGGDCAYKARAFIVLLRHLGIEASKLALYDPSGKPVHAVALAQTERGPYVVDLRFGIVFDDAQGYPIPLKSLKADRRVLNDVVDREVAVGNAWCRKYKRDRFVYDNVRTINWEKNAAWRLVYQALAATCGAEAVDHFARPYCAEEPALLVMIGTSGLLLGIVIMLPLWRARRGRRQQANQPRSSGYTENEPELASVGADV